jgi:hypothetical protein
VTTEETSRETKMLERVQKRFFQNVYPQLSHREAFKKGQCQFLSNSHPRKFCPKLKKNESKHKIKP